MEAISSKPGRINYRSWKTGLPEGHTVMSNHRARYNAPYWQVYRPDYHTVLLNAAVERRVTLRKGAGVAQYKPEEPAVILETGEVVKGDLVIAADGVKSFAREAVGKDIEPHETGDTCFRVVIPRDCLLGDTDLAELSTSPNFEQWLGPDHHIIGYVFSNQAVHPCRKKKLMFSTGIICRRRSRSTYSWSSPTTEK